MSILEQVTDTWLAHLPFTQVRQTPYGPADGLFFGNLAVDGDGTGGIVDLQGRISRDRKEDWVYLLKGRSSQVFADNNGEIATFLGTGPVIVAGATTSPSFTALDNMVNDATLAFSSGSSGNFGSPGRPLEQFLFGDRNLAGDYGMITSRFSVNTTAALYQVSIWGFIFRYQSFFRGVPPSRG